MEERQHNMGDSAESASSPGGEQRGKRCRASRPKVKTGCQTCKIRRVKCDETKPSCLRCIKFGHQCDGYAPKAASKPAAPGTPSRTLVPKGQKPAAISPVISPVSPESSLLPSISSKLQHPPSMNVFQNDQEYHSFQHFCSQTAVQLSTFFTKDLWTRLMLQACETSPSIRHAIIAIGALNLSTPSVRSIEVGTLRHQFAFRQYSKSVCMMRRDVAGGRHDIRTTLIACLLFYCFESYHGYHELAISQVYTGLRLIRDWATSFHRSDWKATTASKFGSENPYEVEDDIVRAFGSLEIQVMTYADGRSADLHEHYRHSGQGSIDRMPVVFGDLTEARTMLELVILRSMHWLRSTMAVHNFSNDRIGHFGEAGISVNVQEDKANLFFDINPKFEEQNATLNEYDRWDAAFQPLMRRARTLEGDEMFYLASMLRLHWLAGYMSIASNNCRTNEGRFTKELEELVGIARLLVDQPTSFSRQSKGTGFVFDMQIIVPLMVVGWVYRHRALRKEAIELLLRSPRKEGIWDGIVVGNAMAWLSGIEEEGLTYEERDIEYVPERVAARSIRMGFETEKREAHISCMQPVKGSMTGEEVKREVVIPW